MRRRFGKDADAEIIFSLAQAISEQTMTYSYQLVPETSSRDYVNIRERGLELDKLQVVKFNILTTIRFNR